MTLPIVQEWEKRHMKKNSTPFKAGDTVKVSVRVFEGDKERVQQYEGIVIRRQGAGLRETFTVRRMSFNIGIERTFPLSSPVIEKIVVGKRGKVRRAKLHYLRALEGKGSKFQEDQGHHQEAAPAAASPEAPANTPVPSAK